ncbi:uncharacterized protein LOC126324477 [Schistocerca gregaria]|uniref:uncharacterized protein LOC126324477 n=1 Tax=Schistocerca gregaria TaxID=7010 RepID=UPI00211E8919|nr:uncharacterized protein LOC126324477 [Schistocerca gregaria]
MMSNSTSRKSLPEGGPVSSEVKAAVSAVDLAPDKQTMTPAQEAESSALPLKSDVEEAYGGSVMPYSALEQLKEKLKARKIQSDNVGQRDKNGGSEVQVEKQSSVSQTSGELPSLSEPGGVNVAKSTTKKHSRKQTNSVEPSCHTAVQCPIPVTEGDGVSLKNTARKAVAKSAIESPGTSSAPARPTKIKSLFYQRPEAGGAKKPVSEAPNFGIKPLSELRSINANSSGGHESSTQLDDTPSTASKTGNTEATAGGSPATAAQLNTTKKRKLEGDLSSQSATNKQNSKRPRASGSKPSNTTSPSSPEQDEVSLLRQKLLLQPGSKKETEPSETVSKNSTDHCLAPPEATGTDKNILDRSSAVNSLPINHDPKLLETKQPSSPSGPTIAAPPSPQQSLTTTTNTSQPSASPQVARPRNVPQSADTAVSQPIKPSPAPESIPSKATLKRIISPILYSQKPNSVPVADKSSSVSTTTKQTSSQEEEHLVGNSSLTKPTPIHQAVSSSLPSASTDSNSGKVGSLPKNSPNPPISPHTDRPSGSEQISQSQGSQVQASSTAPSPLPETPTRDHGKPKENAGLSLSTPPSSVAATHASSDIPAINPSPCSEPMQSSSSETTQAMLEEILKVDAEIARLHKQVRILELELNVNFKT